MRYLIISENCPKCREVENSCDLSEVTVLDVSSPEATAMCLFCGVSSIPVLIDAKDELQGYPYAVVLADSVSGIKEALSSKS